VEDEDEKDWGSEGEVCGGAESDRGDGESKIVQQEQDCCGEGGGAWHWPWGVVIE
jgi:hypothetical protein